MARPTKKGLDYFPLDCHMDEKIELIEVEFGLKGFALVVKLLQRIYGGNGYYCEWNDDIALLFARGCGLSSGDVNLVKEVVSAAMKRGIFSKEMYENYGILTSSGIQKRYRAACGRRAEVEMNEEFLVGENVEKKVIAYNNGVSAYKNPLFDGVSAYNNPNFEGVFTYNNPQSKVKESKVNKNKRNETKGNERKGNETKRACAREAGRLYETYWGPVSSKAAQDLIYWSDRMDAVLICHAIEIAASRDKRWTYAAAILKNWEEAGIETLAQAEAEEEAFRRKKEGRKETANPFLEMLREEERK